MNYSLHSAAEQDLRSAAQFYAQHAGKALSQAFIREFEHVMTVLVQHPEVGLPWRSGKRRFIMQRFPYSVIYLRAGDEIRVLAVAHHSRKPGYWRQREG